jgi:hypothetical protein
VWVHLPVAIFTKEGVPGLRSPALTRYDEDGALADERDRHRMGAHALARDAARGVGGADEDRLIKLSPKIELRCRRAYEVWDFGLSRLWD